MKDNSTTFNGLHESEMKRIRKAWEEIPLGTRKVLYDELNFTQQNVDDILKNGRKDVNKIKHLLQGIKQASNIVEQQVKTQNKIVQST